MATEVGVGYVRLVPTMRGFAAAAQRQMTGQLAPVANRVGQNAGSTLAAGVGGGMTAASGRMRSAGQTLTRSVSLPLAGVGLLALKMSGDFEASMNRVKAVSGATGKDFDALREQAKQLGATTQFSASEAADGMGFLAMAGFKTKDIMAAMPGVLNLAAA
ncbi:phage tail tape measure protein, partial [Streptomyces sp. bgisy153]|uniref:phage tail tape measure protein n=1 Tax=Streptomyces sp. bgisy153 TaxID=3413793 RepID=UPI003D7173A3